MRFSLVLLCGALALTGCKKDDAASGDDTAPDAAGSGSGSGSDMGQDPNAAFYVRSTDMTLQPGDEVTKCFYFHTSNTTMKPISKWVAHMSPGSHHMIMYFPQNGQNAGADGTIDEACNNNIPIWIFASQQQDLTLQFPTDDGNGQPLAQEVPANQAAYFQMHYINTTDQPMTVHVELNAYATTATTYTKTSPFVTYQFNISIPPDAVGTTVTQSCTPPAGVKFWEMSTHAHKQAVHTEVFDGSTSLFASDDWEHPGDKEWNANPFYTFSGKLTWTCIYNNNDPNDPNHTTTVSQGQSAATQEMCMATAYTFPSPKTSACVCQGASCTNITL
ncbi:MAG: hypothetical protein QM831_26040 [Kofleriaceae bacterium]